VNQVDVLRYGQRTIDDLVGRLRTDDWEAIAIGVWTTKDLVGHLGAFEVRFADVLAIFLGESPTSSLLRDDPSTFNDDQAAVRRDWSVGDVLDEYREASNRVMRLAAQVPTARWVEVGTIPWYGPSTPWTTCWSIRCTATSASTRRSWRPFSIDPGGDGAHRRRVHRGRKRLARSSGTVLDENLIGASCRRLPRSRQAGGRRRSRNLEREGSMGRRSRRLGSPRPKRIRSFYVVLAMNVRRRGCISAFRSRRAGVPRA
jgi:hypothetical protein